MLLELLEFPPLVVAAQARLNCTMPEPYDLQLAVFKMLSLKPSHAIEPELSRMNMMFGLAPLVELVSMGTLEGEISGAAPTFIEETEESAYAHGRSLRAAVGLKSDFFMVSACGRET